jgi:hypothetical protein
MSLLVCHLLQPGATHVLLTHLVLLPLLSIFGGLKVQSSLKALLVHQVVLEPANFAVSCLVVKLSLKRVVLPLNLTVVSISHLLDDLLGFFGAKVRLVVLLVSKVVRVTCLFIPLHLQVNEILVLLLGRQSLIPSLLSLSFRVFDIVYELRLLRLTKLLQTKEFVLVTVKCGKSRLVCDGWLSITDFGINMAKTMIVDGERTFRSKEGGHVCVVSL